MGHKCDLCHKMMERKEEKPAQMNHLMMARHLASPM